MQGLFEHNPNERRDNTEDQQVGSCQITKLLHSEGDNQPSQETTYRMGENFCLLINGQRVNI